MFLRAVVKVVLGIASLEWIRLGVVSQALLAGRFAEISLLAFVHI